MILTFVFKMGRRCRFPVTNALDSPLMVTTLLELPLRSRAKIVQVGGPPGFRRRLMELGLVPGTTVEVVRIAPLGDPIQLLVRGCRLSIRRGEAAELHVFVEGSEPAAGGCEGCPL